MEYHEDRDGTKMKQIVLGRAIAQAVSRQVPITAARFRALVRSCRICGCQSGTGAGFSRVLPFDSPAN
jgi:hypothetical protein